MIVTTEADFSPAAMDIEAASSNGLDTSGNLLKSSGQNL